MERKQRMGIFRQPPNASKRSNEMRNKLDHIAICVQDISSAIVRYEKLLGVPPQAVSEIEEEAVYRAFFVLQNVSIELIAPLTPTAPLQRFIDTHGEGLHHICLHANDADSDAQDLHKKGFGFIYKKAKPLKDGYKINFIHPRHTNRVLIELKSPC